MIHVEVEHTAGPRLPRGIVTGAAAMVLATILLAWWGHAHGLGVTELPPGAPLAVRDLRFTDQSTGGVEVQDASTKAIVGTLAPGTGGFVRGALRALVRERRARRLDPGVPFRLARWPKERLTLEDLATGTRIELEAFGPTNAEAFDRLLPNR